MSEVSLKISVRDEVALQANRELGRALRPEEVKPVAGRAASNLFREHFFQLNRERVGMPGAQKTNFYGDAARGTFYTETQTGAVVNVAKLGIAQRLFGGTIRPRKPTGFLTIPASPLSYGKRAREFTNLRFLYRFPDMRPFALATTVESEPVSASKKTSKRLKKAPGEILFWLLKSVTQDPDPSVIPAPEVTRTAVKGAITARILALKARKWRP